MADDKSANAKEWTSFAVDEKFFDYADELTPYGVAARYPSELFLEERHAEKAIRMAKEFVEWSKSIIAAAESED